jgi:hypothetical protein
VHDFNYRPYKHDILDIGGKGKGKTTRAQKIIQTIEGINYWIWDYSDKFSEYGKLVHRVEDLQKGQYVIQAHDKGKANYAKFLNRAFYNFKNIVVVTDELHQYTNKNEIFQPLYEFVLSGRNKGLSSIFITTRPQSVPNYILSNLQHIFAYPLNLQSDIEWLREYIGPEAWLLIPKDKRRQFYLKPDHYDVLPEFSYIYRNLNDARPSVVTK